MHVETLERRQFMDGAITGGPGHAGFLVDIRDRDGNITGVLAVDYYAAGYMGETPGTDGSCDDSCGDPVRGAQGRVMGVYTPGTTVQQRMGTVHPDYIIQGGIAGDQRVARYIRDITDCMIDPSSYADDTTSSETRCDATGIFATYYVWDVNCYTFSNELMEQAGGVNAGWPCTWDGLTENLGTVKTYMRKRLLSAIQEKPLFSKMHNIEISQ